MREIKFRVWHIKKKKMFCVESLHLQDEYCVLNDGDIYSDAFCAKTSEIELMQFTGLKDVNGVEIYEGDIVKALHPDGEYNFVDVVEFGNGTFKFKDTKLSDGTHDWYSLEQYGSSDMEVIGNIHQHPELLEGKKMTQKLNWTTNDVANTRSHTYRVETIGNNSRVIYSKIGDNPAFVSSDFDSVEAAKQWAQNYHNKYGADDE